MDENYRNIMEDTCIDRENGKSLSQQENSLTEYNAHNGEATDCINDSGEVDKADTLKSTITRGDAFRNGESIRNYTDVSGYAITRVLPCIDPND